MYHTALDLIEFLFISFLIFLGSSKFDLPDTALDLTSFLFISLLIFIGSKFDLPDEHDISD